MSMKRFLLLLLVLTLLYVPLASAGPLTKVRQPEVELHGLIDQVLDGGVLLNDIAQGPVLLNVDTETVLEGTLAQTPLTEGMYVYAKYNGILTRTQPPQTHADRLGCYTLQGTVSEVMGESLMLTGDELFGDTIVRLSQHHPHVFTGVPITVYYNGTMALSFPRQVDASYVVVPVLTGTVKQVSEDSLSLVTEDDQEYAVSVDGLTLLPSSWFEGELVGKQITVYYDGTIQGQNKLRSLEIVDPSSILQDTTPLPTPAVEEATPSPEASTEPTVSPQNSLKPESTAATASPAPSASPSTAPSPTSTEAAP